MVEQTPIPFFTDDIQITAHTTSTSMKDAIGRPMSVREFAERVEAPVSLGKTPEGDLYLATGRYPNIQWVQGPEFLAAATAA
jgi:hypothetical protein